MGSYLRISLLHQIYKKERYIIVEKGNLLLSDDFCLQLCVSKDIHRFLGVFSPSAWSMRLCLQALRMSTTFTELIFPLFLSSFLESQNWTEEVVPCRALNTNWRRIGKLLVWSRSVSVQPLENSGRCARGFEGWSMKTGQARGRCVGHIEL